MDGRQYPFACWYWLSILYGVWNNTFLLKIIMPFRGYRKSNKNYISCSTFASTVEAENWKTAAGACSFFLCKYKSKRENGRRKEKRKTACVLVWPKENSLVLKCKTANTWAMPVARQGRVSGRAEQIAGRWTRWRGRQKVNLGKVKAEIKIAIQSTTRCNTRQRTALHL